MPQAEKTVTFPVNVCTTDFLQEFIGTDQERFEGIAIRLAGIGALLFFLKSAQEESPRMMANALMGIETAVNDCLAVIDMRPLELAR